MSLEAEFKAQLNRLPQNILVDAVDRIRLFLFALCDPGSPLNRKYGSADLIEVHQRIIQEATGLSGSGFQSALRLLDHETLGLVRVLRNKPIRVLRPTREELTELMDIRILLETEAALRLHRNDDGKLEWMGVSDETVKKLEQQRLRLEAAYPKGVPAGENSDDIAHLIETEYFWKIDTKLHTDIFVAAGWSISPTIVQLLRDKMRLVGSRRKVIAGRMEAAQEEHRALLEAINARHRGEETEQRVRETVFCHLDNARQYLLSESEAGL